MLQTVIAGLVMVGVLVVIHEAGHFFVARFFGIGAPVFSIGMGPRLFGFHWRGTDFRISAIPAGGYVQLAGADPFGEEDAESQVPPDEDFMRKPVWQRLLVMFAGPAANLILPFVLFTAVLMLGEPQPDPSVGTVLPGTYAETLDVQSGDVIRAVDGRRVDAWIDAVRAIEGALPGPVALTLQRGDQTHEVLLPAEALRHSEAGYLDMEALGISSTRVSSRIGVDDPTSPAARAGLRTGDGIVSIDGTPVETWDEVVAALDPSSEQRITVVRAVDGEVVEQELSLVADPEWSPREGDPLANAYGLAPVMLFVGQVLPDSAADQAGILADDRLYRIDGQPVRGWSELIRMVSATVDEAGPDAKPRALTLDLVRDGELLSLSFTPQVERELRPSGIHYRPLIGIAQYPQAFRSGPRIQKYYGVVEAVPRAVEEGVAVFSGTIMVLSNLFTGQLTPMESIGGPIEIFRAAGEGARRGLHSFVRLMGTISFSLGIINLLPIPVLDGGQIVFYTIEGIRGRPLSLQLRERIQMIGVLGLVALMLMVTVMDVSRWLGS